MYWEIMLVIMIYLGKHTNWMERLIKINMLKDINCSVNIFINHFSEKSILWIQKYSIHDAIEAGFNHVVFIIRKDIEKEFKEVIGERIATICKKYNVTVGYAFQDINDIPGTLPAGRTKPWGIKF